MASIVSSFHSPRNPEVSLPSKYQCKQCIGRGAYGDVYEALDNKSGETVVVKRVRNLFASATVAKRAYRELKINQFLKAENHDNIVQFIEAVHPTTDGDRMSEVVLVMEKMTCDLQKFYLSFQSMKGDEITYLLYGILRGLKFIHSAGIIHRDLKPSNILVTDWDCKICDFGLGTRENDDMSDYVQTRIYRAPEVVLASCEYEKAIDMWSFGCIAVELLIGRPLFGSSSIKTHRQLLTAYFEYLGVPSHEELWYAHAQAMTIANDLVVELKNTPNYDPKEPLVHKLLQQRRQECPKLVDLALKCLDFNPYARLTAEEALSHPCFKEYGDHTDAEEPKSKYELVIDRKVEASNDGQFIRGKLHDAILGIDDDEWYDGQEEEEEE